MFSNFAPSCLLAQHKNAQKVQKTAYCKKEKKRSYEKKTKLSQIQNFAWSRVWYLVFPKLFVYNSEVDILSQ